MKSLNLKSRSVILSHYIQKAMEKGLLPSLIEKDLKDLKIDKKEIEKAFNEASTSINYNKLCPQRIKDRELVRPLVDYLKLARKNSVLKKNLEANARKKGWKKQEFDLAWNLSKPSP